MKAPKFAYLSDVSCKADEKYPVAAAGVAEFERWTGCMLSDSHRRVIATLEWLRSQSDLPRRVWVHDDGKCGDIVKKLLVDYMRWLDDKINKSGQAKRIARTLMMARGVKTAKALCALAPKDHFLPATIRKPLSIYGQRFMNALVLDADKCPQSRYGLRYNEMRRAVLPAAPECGLVIVHGNARRWSTLFSSDFRSMAADDCLMTVIAANPVKERRPGYDRERKQRPHPEEVRLQKALDRAKERLASDDCEYSLLDPSLRLSRAYLRDNVQHAEAELAKWRALHLPLIMERAERRKVLDLVYEIAPHLPRQVSVKELAIAHSRRALKAGDVVEATLRAEREERGERNDASANVSLEPDSCREAL